MQERFSYKEVKFKKFYPAVTTNVPPGTPVGGEGTLITFTGIMFTNGIRNPLLIDALY